MSWLPRKVGNEYALESASVYQSSLAKKSASRWVGALYDANPRAATWNGKSRIACIPSWVV